ncbi:MAG: serine/threonine-protein kinase [Gemmataceae bacterium]|nr:serine/threonine-protein kinase [Gemmataceae bacterium]
MAFDVPPTTVDGSPPGEPLGAVPEPGRYRAVRPHARGGLGEVLYAEEDELGRPVALKRLLGPRADDPESRRRFLREAAITARLQHPGIVPVYGLSRDEHGRPAYAMRFVEGESLLGAIQTAHAAPDRTFAVRQLLARFATVCETIAYAHARGVIHRDIKPANILLGPFGETLVVDWGLAKVVGTPEAIPAEAAGDTAIATETRAGLTMGTPAYMSPEQAAGRWTEVGPASDIYSLGATLFQILTRQPPFVGNIADVLSAIDRGATPRARTVASGVPAALDAVCRKAMAHRPADRYASAQELAADINRWLADEPVSAGGEPLRTRVARWFRRRKALTAALAGLTLTSIFALGVGLWAVNRERVQTRIERDDARVQRERTRAALDAMTSNLTERWLKSSNALRPEQIDFLNRALVYYQDFARDDATDEAGRQRVVQAQTRVATLLYNLDRAEEAEAAYRTALSAWERLLSEYPANPVCLHARGEVLSNLGNLLKDQGRYTEAEPILRRAVDEVAARARSAPADDAVRGEWGWVLNNLAVTLKAAGKLNDAGLTYQQAAESLEMLVRAHPKNEEHSRDLANVAVNLGNLLNKQGRPADAEPYYQRSVALYSDLAKRRPDDPDILCDLARAHGNFAAMYAASKALEPADRQYHKAIDVLEPLCRDYPASIKYRTLLALTYANYSQLFSRQGQYPPTLEWLNRSETILRQIVDGGAKQAEPRIYLGIVLAGKVDALQNLGRWSDAVTACDAGLALGDKSKATDFAVERAWSRAHTADKEAARREARELSRRDGLTAAQLLTLGLTLSATDDFAEAVALVKKAHAVDPKVLSNGKDDPELNRLRARPEARELPADAKP